MTSNPKQQPQVDMRPQAILSRLYLMNELYRVGIVLRQAHKCDKKPAGILESKRAEAGSEKG